MSGSETAVMHSLGVEYLLLIRLRYGNLGRRLNFGHVKLRLTVLGIGKEACKRRR